MRKTHTFYAFSLLLGLLVMTSCSSDEEPAPPATSTPVVNTLTIWDGPMISFTKEVGSDPSDAANQDRLTDNVWITRGTSGGEIFNARTEDDFLKGISPAGTSWSFGTTANLSALQFESFRTAVGSPREVVGEDLVLRLIEDDILVDVRFTSWSQGRQEGGGFSYMRSTPQ